MSDSSALVTVAMLSTMLSERHTDYLDIISPFVLTLLPLKTGDRVDAGKIINSLKENYGFVQFPTHVLTKILIRYSKQKYGYLEKCNGEFFVKKPYERSRFTECQREIREAQSIVMDQLQNFLLENSRYTNITIERTRELFLHFLEQKGLAFVDGIEGLKTITTKNYDLFQVARFILVEYERRSVTFIHIEEVVRGFFVYKSIYFFSREGIVSLTAKMKETVIYFDTRLLIEALGYNTQEGAIATKELISLIHDCGGKVKTFSHLVDEVDGILYAFSKSIEKKASFSLQYLLVNKYNEVDINRIRTSLKTNLHKLGIDVAEPISYRELGSDEYAPLQVNDLSFAIQNAYSLTNQTTRSDNDVLSVASIYNLRRNARCSSLENCRAVMVTTNLGFINTVQEFYRETSTHNIDFVLSDIDITAVLWLRSWDKKSTLPSIILLENAYAACQPTLELITAFGNIVEKLRGEGTITDDEALLLRTQPAPCADLLALAQNDASAVNDTMVMEVRKRYAESLTAPQKDEISRLQTELNRHREHDNERKRKAINYAEKIANQSAEAHEKALKVVTKIISIVFILVGFFALCYSHISADLELLWKIVLVVIGLFGLVDVIRSRNGFISKMITLNRNKRFQKVHAKEMTRVCREFYELGE